MYLDLPCIAINKVLSGCFDSSYAPQKPSSNLGERVKTEIRYCYVYIQSYCKLLIADCKSWQAF